jgi:N utilization substance protein B
MSRRQAREVALQALFQLDLNRSEGEDQQEMYETLALDTALGENEKLPKRDREYARTIVQGTRQNLEAIDEMLAAASHEWKVERMAAVDRNIARLAVFEIRFGQEEITPKIVINEAVELAKKYGTDDSGRFVNGILGAIVK